MKGRTITFLVVLALAVASSGCLGGAKKAQPASTDEASNGAATNSLSGFVFTTDELPVAEALVRVEGVEGGRTTNAEGGYRFVNLPPGEHTLRVEKAGYRPGEERATVQDGYATVVNVTLEEAPPESFHETEPFNGLVSCHATVGDDPDTGMTQDCSTADPNAKSSNEFTIREGAAQVQIEFFWTQTTAAARNLTVRVETVDLGALNIAFAHYPISSGTKVTIGEANMDKYFPKGGKLRVSLYSASSLRMEPVPAGAGLAFQQPFEVDFTIFYGEPGPSDFSYQK